MMFNTNRMRFACVLACALLFSLTRPSRAEDWPRIIENLKRGASSRQEKQQLAIAYNNYAIELSNQGNWPQAETELQRAVAIDANNDQFKQNLSVIYLNHVSSMRQDRRASDRGTDVKSKILVQQALRFNPQSADAYAILGDIAYDSQQLTHAKTAWDRAKRLDPSMTSIDERLNKLNAEQAVEKQFDRAGNVHFDLRYQDGIGYSTAYDLRTVLDQARRDVGRDFGYWPRHQIVVLVYSEEAFQQVRPGPDWIAGLYDGKIRIPFPRSAAAQTSLKATLVHEYTHAIIHDITRNQCPVWLNEGLAEFEEARTRKPDSQHLQNAVRHDRLIPLASLDTAFKSRDPNVAALGYQQSYALVTYLDQTYRFFRIRKILDQLAEGISIEEAFQAELRLSTSQLEQRWQRWLPTFVQDSLAKR
ncbi:MAG: peptidase MA family metallohydrolase [Planctomycetota bacterium]|nr:peptidase MA family metallohydrolase [Planctomycetota bacterium]